MCVHQLVVVAVVEEYSLDHSVVCVQLLDESSTYHGGIEMDHTFTLKPVERR